MTVMSPRNGAHKFWTNDRFPVVVARNAITVALELASVEDKFLLALTNYAGEFCEVLREVIFAFEIICPLFFLLF